MKIYKIYILILLLTMSACKSQNDQIQSWKNEIMKTEHEFNQMANTEGIAKAFIAYAAEDAVLSRGNKLIIGKKAIQEFYENQNLAKASLNWEPQFIDVSEDGNLGYTYGHYNFTKIDSTGNSIQSSGIFHTVWKRQPDGTWKFVWD